MASSSRRSSSTFNLSFLDIMFCGFGAVVLLVLLISSHSVSRREDRVSEFRADLLREETELRLVDEQLQRQRSEIEAIRDTIATLQAEAQGVSAEIARLGQGAPAVLESGAGRETIAALQEELKALEREKQELASQVQISRREGRQVRAFVGDGNRQYLTGLKLDGKRVLILVDSSASMLDRNIVDIIRRKVLDEASRRRAPKWQRVLATVQWLIANLPVTSSIQLVHFNTSSIDLGGEGNSGWIPVTDFGRIDALLAELKQVAPLGGTNLDEPFLAARTLTPQPDNIVLITDGLPTQGRKGRQARTIDGPARVRLYEQAVKNLPTKVPVNTILFPIEGDPMAAVLYWKLALDTGGSFFTPTRDWP